LFSENTSLAVHVAKEMAVKEKIPIALVPSSTYFLKTNQLQILSFLENITFLFPNYEEGTLLTGEEDPRRILNRLRDYVPHPVLKLGEKGCLLFHQGSYIEVTPEKVNPVDSTGAGDSFAGIFLAEYYKTQDILKSAQKAVEISSKVVEQIGARPPIGARN
jgi:ribokinase